MPELTPPARRRDPRRHSARGPAGLRSFHLLVALLPAALLTLAGAGVVLFLLAGPYPAGVARPVLIAAAAVAVIVLAAAAWGATAATRRVRDRLAGLRSVSIRSQADLLLLAERLQQGERPALRSPDPVPGAAGDPFTQLARDLQQERHAAREALLQLAVNMPGGSADPRAEVSASLAARLESLAGRESELLRELRGQVWDPAVRQGLLAADHLAIHTRRLLGNLAVVAGAGPLRQWAQSLSVHDVLQEAAAEVEHPTRVTVVPPADGSLRPAVVADVIHLVAELADNASRFAPPGARTLVRADAVAAGLAIEVEDRGFGLNATDRHRVNALLSHPNRAEASQLLSAGRTGLFVVSELARRHGIEVQLQGNIYGGTQAVVVLPGDLLEDGARDRELPQLPPQAEPAAAVAEPAAPGEPAAAAQPEPAGADRAAPPEPATSPAGDDTPVLFRRVIPPPPAAPGWPESSSPASGWPDSPSFAPGWPECSLPPPPAPPDPPGVPADPPSKPAELNGLNGLNGHSLLRPGGQPVPAPPPQEEQVTGRDGTASDRIADLMAAFRDSAGRDAREPDQDPDSRLADSGPDQPP